MKKINTYSAQYKIIQPRKNNPNPPTPQSFARSFTPKSNSIPNKKEAGTCPSRRHIQGSKIAKRLPSVKYSFLQYSKIFEKITYSNQWTERRDQGSQCRKTEKGDSLRFFNIQSVAKHEKIEENKYFRFREKVSQCRKTERGDLLRFFNIHSVAKNEKNEENKSFNFGKKSHKAEKNERGGPWDCSTSILSQNIKKMQGGPFGEKFFEKIVSQCRKKMKGGPFGLARYGMLRGKTFLVKFARPNSAIWCNNVL